MNKALILSAAAVLVASAAIADRAQAAVMAPHGLQSAIAGFGTATKTLVKKPRRKTDDLDNGPKNPGGTVNTKARQGKQPTMNNIAGPKPVTPPKP